MAVSFAQGKRQSGCSMLSPPHGRHNCHCASSCKQLGKMPQGSCCQGSRVALTHRGIQGVQLEVFHVVIPLNRWAVRSASQQLALHSLWAAEEQSRHCRKQTGGQVQNQGQREDRHAHLLCMGTWDQPACSGHGGGDSKTVPQRCMLPQHYRDTSTRTHAKDTNLQDG